MPPSGRQYSESEIAQLLKRATELQNLDQGSKGSGLSLEDVEQIAVETGIDPTYVRAAAADLLRAPEAPRKKGFRILGAPVYLDAERTVDGPLSDEVWAGIADELSRTYRTSGRSQAVGAGREWTYGGSRTLREVRVSATPVRGKTRIRITEEFGREAFLNFFLPLYAVGILTGVVLGEALSLGPEIAITSVIAALATVFFAIRMIFSARVRRREDKHRELLDRLETLVESSSDELSEGAVSGALPESAGTTRAARIDLPDAEEPDSPEIARERRRER